MVRRSLKTCEIKCPTDKADGLLRAIGWLTAAAAGGVVFWKWSQINSSGVPLNFALRRTFSRDFFEGHIDLSRAYEEKREARVAA